MADNLYNLSTAALRAEPERCRVTALQSVCCSRSTLAKRVRSGVVIGIVSLLVGLGASASACNYGNYGFQPGDSSQTDPDGLFRGIYEVGREYKTADWRKEAQGLQRQANSADIIERLDYAWALHMANENEKALPVYEEILKTQPDHYETLCSYATVLGNMRRYPQAIEVLKRAVALKPGFRQHAEEFHLAMLDYEQKSRANAQYGASNIFLPELTPLWMNHPLDVEKNLSTVENWPERVISDGVAELVRQFPNFADGWMVLGMALEHEEDFSMAAKAYDKALAGGTRHATKLGQWMETFEEYGRSQDPARLGGRKVVQLGIALVVLAVAWYFIKFIAGVISDVTQRRADRANRKRAERLKNFKDPDAPL